MDATGQFSKFILIVHPVYYSDCAVTRPANKALNDEDAKKLWDLSAELVGLGDYNPFTAQDPGLKSAN